MALRDIALARHCSRVLQPRNEKIQEIELSMRTVKRPLFFLILLFKVSPEGIYGVRGGVFTNNYFEFEGNFGYISKLELRERSQRRNSISGKVWLRITSRGFITGTLLLASAA